MENISLKQLYLQDTAFQNLMQRRIFNVLLVASDYDAFMLEEDGRIEEQLFFEYAQLNLSSPPRVTRVSTIERAVALMSEKTFDVVFLMPGTDIGQALSGASELKEVNAATPVILLTPFSHEVSRRIEHEDLSAVDFVFSWLGNVDLLLAIIKLLEDRMNADNDISQVGVQLILVVEDSVRFYSAVLPTLYKFLLRQSQMFATEALNEHEQMLRMRGRPKVMLARDYEEAWALYEQYRKHILGIISDVSFKRGGVKDTEAGLKLARQIRRSDPYVPIIIESSETDNALKISDFNGVFVDKNSKKLPVDLDAAITRNFGFGDFVVRNPSDNTEVMRLSSLKDLQRHIDDIPDESLFYHSAKNDISRWLYSRAMFPIANVLKDLRVKDISQAPKIREVVTDAIVKYRRMKNRGVVAVYRRDRFDRYSNFARIGQGSLGGKARGLAFIDSIIKKREKADAIPGIGINIPRTVVLCTDIFDEFMADNNLYQIALSNASDNDILQHFLNASLPERLRDDFLSLFNVVDTPLAVRSSSLLEDSHYQPFAGVYSTYMIPRSTNRELMLKNLTDAIKGVYASVFFSASKTYMNATRNVIDQEKMAVIIQEVVGQSCGEVYFPSFSGVGRSLNYYPIGNEQPTDGTAEVAVGLGKYIVDGGTALRFCPRYPRAVLQTSTLDLALKSTQTYFDALKAVETEVETFTPDDGLNIVKRNIGDYAGNPVLDYMVSTYNASDDRLTDNNRGRGRRVVTFANILRDNAFPLAQAVEYMLNVGSRAMGRPVEIEFAGQINHDDKTRSTDKGQIYWLQIRPIADPKTSVDEKILRAPESDIILRSNSALGHGTFDSLKTIVYVKPDAFNSLDSVNIATQLSDINKKLSAADTRYILIGPGRWGTSDPALGIPVKWTDISSAGLIVETTLEDFNVEPSQGTHFFQNLTSFGVGYLTYNQFAQGGIYDVDYLDGLKADIETPYIRVVSFGESLPIGIDALHGIGVILKPKIGDPE